AVGAGAAAGLAGARAAHVRHARGRAHRLTGAAAVAGARRGVGRSAARFPDADDARRPHPAGARAVAHAVGAAGRLRALGAAVVGIGAAGDGAAEAVRLPGLRGRTRHAGAAARRLAADAVDAVAAGALAAAAAGGAVPPLRDARARRAEVAAG